MLRILGKLVDSKTCQMTYRTGSRRYQFINKLSIDRQISITIDRWRPYLRSTKVFWQAILSEDSILQHQKWLLKQHLPSQLETTDVQSLSRSIKLDEYTQKPTLSPSCCLSHPLCIHRLDPSASLSTVDRYESSVTQDQSILWRFNLR